MAKTGNFPAGKLIDSDEGEIQIAIGIRDGAVVIDFGTPMVWIGFYSSHARQIAAALIAKADELDKKAH
jgi:hypothetical protein